MSDPIDLLGVYLHLVRASQQRQRYHVRDRLLILAAVFASQYGLARIAAYCRRQVLAHNPQHLVRRWPTISEALDDPEFEHFLRHLYRRYPRETAERMLDTLGIEQARERATYYSDEEYAAALLGVTQQSLDQMFGESGGD